MGRTNGKSVSIANNNDNLYRGRVGIGTTGYNAFSDTTTLFECKGIASIDKLGINTTTTPSLPLTSSLYIYNPAINNESIYIKSTHEDPNYIIGDGSFIIDKGGAVGIGTTITNTYGINLYHGAFLMTNGVLSINDEATSPYADQSIKFETNKANQYQRITLQNYASTPVRYAEIKLDTDGYMKYDITRSPLTGHKFSINGTGKIFIEDTTTTIANNLDVGILTISSPSATESRITIDDSIPNTNFLTIYTNNTEQLRIDEFKTSIRQLNAKEVYTYRNQQTVSNGNTLVMGIDGYLNTILNYPTGLYAYNVNAVFSGALINTTYASGFFHYIKGSGAITITNTFISGLTITRLAGGDIQITNASGSTLTLTASYAPVATAYAI